MVCSIVCVYVLPSKVLNIRDDNSCEQFLLVSNNSENCELAIEGRDIFSATRQAWESQFCLKNSALGHQFQGRSKIKKIPPPKCSWVWLLCGGTLTLSVLCLYRRLIQRKLQSTEEVNIKALKTLDSKLGEWQLKLKHVSKEDVKDLQRKRAKETVATTFNKLGIVVPYDKTTELGYRPLPMTNSEYHSITYSPM